MEQTNLMFWHKGETVVSWFQQVFTLKTMCISPYTPPSSLSPHFQWEPWSAFKTHWPTSIVPRNRIINLGSYATFCRDLMQPIKELIWKTAQMTGQIRLSMKSCFVKNFTHKVRLDNDQALSHSHTLSIRVTILKQSFSKYCTTETNYCIIDLINTLQ